MELKDVILSTLEELEQSKDSIAPSPQKARTSSLKKEALVQEKKPVSDALNSSEELYLNNMKERIHVLFEGFQSPNNTNIEAKVDLTLNFLEYLLSTIETRLSEIKK